MTKLGDFEKDFIDFSLLVLQTFPSRRDHQ